MAAVLFRRRELDLGTVLDYSQAILVGLWTTVVLTVTSFVLGAILGLALALARLSSHPWVRRPAVIYINVFLSTPILIQLFWLYYVLPQTAGIRMPDVQVLILTLSLNAAASMAEVYRAGIGAVDPGQRDACSVLGLSWYQTMRWVIVAQAIRLVLPPLASAAISLVKDSSLATFIGATDLLNSARTVAIHTFRPVEIFTLVAVIYFLLTYPIAILSAHLERRWQLVRV